MITVIGKDEQHLKRVTCKNCVSILEYSLSDVQRDKEMDYGGGVTVYKYIVCPCCAKKVILSMY